MKTGGRQAGTPNRSAVALRDRVETEAGPPLLVMVARIGRQALEAGQPPLAVVALSKAAVYTYGRPQAQVEAHEPLPCMTLIDDKTPSPPQRNTDWLLNFVVRLPSLPTV
jgi:hypothetical protein